MLFEQFIGLELLRSVHMNGREVKIRFWRDPDGPEVDWVIDNDGFYTPLEVKWTDSPASSDVRHLEVFLSEYKTAKTGFLVCRVPRKVKLSEKVFALPWQSVNDVLKSNLSA